MKHLTLIFTLLIFTFNGCTHTSVPQPRHYQAPTTAKAPLFQKRMIEVALSTQEDAYYKKMALNTTQKKQWFKNLMYRLWDRQMTRQEFINEGLNKYPTKRYEFTFVANGFQKRS